MAKLNQKEITNSIKEGKMVKLNQKEIINSIKETDLVSKIFNAIKDCDEDNMGHIVDPEFYLKEEGIDLRKTNFGFSVIRNANPIYLKEEGKMIVPFGIITVPGIETPDNWSSASIKYTSIKTSLRDGCFLTVHFDSGQDNISEESSCYHEPTADATYVSNWYDDTCLLMVMELNYKPSIYDVWGHNIVEASSGFIYYGSRGTIHVYDVLPVGELRHVASIDPEVIDISGYDFVTIKNLLGRL